MSNDAIVNEYLARLAAAAVDLPAERRPNSSRRSASTSASPSRPRTTPTTRRCTTSSIGSDPAEEIVDAELESTALAGEAAGAVATTPTPWRPHVSTETKALLLLSLGAVFLPFVGPLAGLCGRVVVRPMDARPEADGDRLRHRAAVPAGDHRHPDPAVGSRSRPSSTTSARSSALIPLAGLLPALYLAIVLNVDIVVVERPEHLSARPTRAPPSPRRGCGR